MRRSSSMRYRVREARSSVMGSMIRVGSGSSEKNHKLNLEGRTHNDVEKLFQFVSFQP